jgi:hypothetical protein
MPQRTMPIVALVDLVGLTTASSSTMQTDRLMKMTHYQSNQPHQTHPTCTGVRPTTGSTIRPSTARSVPRVASAGSSSAKGQRTVSSKLEFLDGTSELVTPVPPGVGGVLEI